MVICVNTKYDQKGLLKSIVLYNQIGDVSKYLKYIRYHAFSLPHGHFGQQKWYLLVSLPSLRLREFLFSWVTVDWAAYAVLTAVLSVLSVVGSVSTVGTVGTVSTVAHTSAASASKFM